MEVETAQLDDIAESLARARRRAPSWVLPASKALLVLLDCIAAGGSFMLAFYLREGERVLSESAWAWSREFVPYAGVLFFIVLVRVATLLYHRIYRLQGAFSYVDQAIRVFKATAVGSLLAVAFTFLFRGGTAFREFSYSRGVFVIDFLIALALMLILHLGVRYVQTLARRRGLNLIPTLVVGSGPEAERTVGELGAAPELGYRVVGVVDGGIPTSQRTVAGVPVIGKVSELGGLIRRLQVQEVVITDPNLPSDLLFDSMMGLGRNQKVEFRLAPTLFNMLPQKTSVEQVGVLPMLRLFREPLSDAERFLKRASDLLISVAAVVVSAPLMAVVALAVRLESKGPVFFRQERVGMDGRVFLCFKFRSMRADADEEAHREAYLRNIEGRHDANAGDDETPLFGKVKDDPRVTRVGRFIRRTSLDELPQLFNVILGDMSIVGPRPPIPYEVEEYEARHRKRLDMKPGITGLWQVSGRSRLSFEEMVRIDVYYIENWSLLLDLKIILLTLPAVIRGDGAR
jgi:exopolysaccharide biosynthesis polyprenyl glycosylphosphotransferase